MFRRRKKPEDDYIFDEYDYYYEDDGHYYEDDDDEYFDDGYYYYYYDEDEYEDDDSDSEVTDVVSESAPVKPVADMTNLEKQLAAREIELQTLRQEKDELEAQFSSVKALPKNYQNIEEENKSLQSELEKLREERLKYASQLEAITERNSDSEESARQFQDEINSKQTEIDKLTEELLNVSEDSSSLGTLHDEIADLEKQLTFAKDAKVAADQEVKELRNKNIAAAEEIAKLEVKIGEEPEFTKEDIAEVMLEAKAKARQIVDQAKYDSKKVVSEAERDLTDVTAQAADMYERINQTKGESEIVFAELMQKLADLNELKNLKEVAKKD